MALQLTLSCDSDKIESGPTLIHSTGVENYKIPPEVIRILQENLSNDLLSDHEEGVLCQQGSQRILDILRQNGFILQNQTNDEQKASWTVVQNGNDHSQQPDDPNPTSNDEKEADADAEDQDGDDEGENKEGGEEDQE